MWGRIANLFQAISRLRPQFRLLTLLMLPVMFAVVVAVMQIPREYRHDLSSDQIAAAFVHSTIRCGKDIIGRIYDYEALQSARQKHYGNCADIFSAGRMLVANREEETTAIYCAYRKLTGEKILHGEARFLDAEGTVLASAGWLNGVRHGKWLGFNPSTEKLEIGGEYDHGMKVGTWRVRGRNADSFLTTEIYDRDQLFQRTSGNSHEFKTEVLDKHGWQTKPFNREWKLLEEIINGKETGRYSLNECQELGTIQRKYHTNGKLCFESRYYPRDEDNDLVWTYREWDEHGRAAPTVSLTDTALQLADGTTVSRPRNHPKFWSDSNNAESKQAVSDQLEHIDQYTWERVPQELLLDLTESSNTNSSTRHVHFHDISGRMPQASDRSAFIPYEAMMLLSLSNDRVIVERYGGLCITLPHHRMDWRDRTGALTLSTHVLKFDQVLDNRCKLENLDQIPFRDVIDILQNQHRLPMVIDDSITVQADEPISISVRDVRVRDALGILCEQLSFAVQADVYGIRIVDQCDASADDLPRR